jgi:hypothetical protein
MPTHTRPGVITVKFPCVLRKVVVMHMGCVHRSVRVCVHVCVCKRVLFVRACVYVCECGGPGAACAIHQLHAIGFVPLRSGVIDDMYMVHMAYGSVIEKGDP